MGIYMTALEARCSSRLPARSRGRSSSGTRGDLRMAKSNFIQAFLWVLLLMVTSHVGRVAARDLAEDLGTSEELPEHSSAGSSFMNPESISYFRKALPDVAMPEALSKLVSPLSSSAVHHLMDRIQAGDLDIDETLGATLCSSAGLLCGDMSESESDLMEETNYNNPAALAPADPSSLFLETRLLSEQGMQVPATVFSHIASRRRPRGSFLPRPLAKMLDRLAGKGLDTLLRRFHIKSGSAMAAGTRSSLSFCRNTVPHSGCASSLEDMADLARGMLGASEIKGDSAGKVMLVSSSDLAGNAPEEVLKVVKVVEEKYVEAMLCHHMVAPFALQFCEIVPHSTKVVSVKLKSMSGKSRGITAVALCHMDSSSKWIPAVDVFKALGAKPAQSAACQWLEPDAYAFLATSN